MSEHCTVAQGQWRWASQVRRRDPRLLLGLGLLLLALGVLHLVPWSSRKVFRADLSKVRPGMSPEDVGRIMRRHIRIEGPHAPRILSYGHSHAPAFDSDVGLIHFERGVVSKVDFLPD